METWRKIQEEIQKELNTTMDCIVHENKEFFYISVYSAYNMEYERALLARKGINTLEISIGTVDEVSHEPSKASKRAVYLLKHKLSKIARRKDCCDYISGVTCNKEEVCLRSGIYSADAKDCVSTSFALGLKHSGRYKEQIKRHGVNGWMASKWMVLKDKTNT